MAGKHYIYKLRSYITKIIKFLLWKTLSLVFLFILIFALIQIPAIQTKIVHRITSSISKKTHSKVEIQRVNISFPKSVVVEGVYFEDLNNDTLLYAGKAKISIALKKLISHKIDIKSLDLEDATLKLGNTKTDSLFNYNFLVAAFGDSSKVEKDEPQTPSKWAFSIGGVSLKNIRFNYNDEYTGMEASVVLRNLEINVDEFDSQRSIYSLDDFLLDGLTANIMVTESTNIQNNQSEIILPKLSVKNLELNNSTLNYTDSVGYVHLSSDLDKFKLEDASIDLQKQLFNTESILLANSKIQYQTFTPESDTIETTISSSNNWKVAVMSIDFDDNSFSYKSGNKAEILNAFNANYLEYSHLKLQATDFQYSSAQTKASIISFSTVDQNEFSINNFSTDFSMDQHSITTKNLKLSTNNSSVDVDLSIEYPSLGALTDSLHFSSLNLDLRNASISNSDILYFNPDLKDQAFFKKTLNVTTASGKISGQMDNLKGEHLDIKSGSNSIIKTDFNISGLSDFQTATFNFPNLKINTGKGDIVMFAGSLLPNSLELPQKINMEAVFKGQLKSFESILKMTSSFGDANVTALIDPAEKFRSNITLVDFELGKVLKDTVMYGQVSLSAEVSGQGLELKTMQAKIKAEATKFYLNEYNYHNLNIDGTISAYEFDGKINLTDENAVFDLEATANLNPGREQVQFTLNLGGADLQKLNFSKTDLRVGMFATADFSGRSVAELNGKVKIADLVLAHEADTYALDSLVFTSVNEPDKSEFKIDSDLADVNYSGSVSPFSIRSGLHQFISQYFPLYDSVSDDNINQLKNFNFDIQLHNHPIISEVIFPDLQEFQPGIIRGGFDSLKNELKLNATINRMVYGSTEMNDFIIDVHSNFQALNYQISCRNISNSLARLNNFLMDGNLADNKMSSIVSSLDDEGNKKLLVSTTIIKEDAGYKLAFDPDNFFLMYDKWNIAKDNYIQFGKEGFLVHHFYLNDEKSQVNIASVNDTFNDDLSIEIKNLALDDISGIFQKDTSLIKGLVDGNVLLKPVNSSYGLIAGLNIKNLIVGNIPVGNLTLNTENTTTEKYNIDLKLLSDDNKLSANGFYVPNGGAQSIHINAEIQSLSMKTVQAFSMGAISKASGKLTGNFLIGGNASLPEITGELSFHNVFITPTFLNNTLELKQESFQLKKDGVYFNSFTILDNNQHSAILDGVVNMNQFRDLKFALKVNARNFLLLNTTSADNSEFYGRMIIDSKIDITGPMSLPVVTAKLKLRKGSKFTFAVPDSRLITDKGEDVVEFETGTNLNPILYQEKKKEKQKSGLSGVDVSFILEIDKEASLRLLMDPSSNDSLVVRGDAALSFNIDRSGKMSLTGAYNLNDGSYVTSLESLIKRKFDIDAGSTIIWNGDPYDADISIDARYEVRASPIDLMSDQMPGLSEADMNGFKQRYPFWVLLKLRGQMLHPEISFEIQLPPDERGILGGAVYQKLNLLNEDESALNKQVFALLVLGRFIQKNPMEMETSGTSTLVRTTVSKFLSQQLNQWSSKVMPGVDLDFDIQSYNDFQSGQAQGRTQVDIGLKKQLFDERLSIQLGGTLDVEGENTRQNSASNITGDVNIEYKLTKDGRYLLKGFRQNQYEGVIEGQLVETGAGIIYVRDFSEWKDFFKKKKKKSEPSKKGTKR